MVDDCFADKVGVVAGVDNDTFILRSHLGGIPSTGYRPRSDRIGDEVAVCFKIADGQGLNI